MDFLQKYKRGIYFEILKSSWTEKMQFLMEFSYL